mmetsp:Transcript_21287/g.27551  ORF Transcript_21287/g.27551 Transcript_21287/m.27551 type:complete len:738 (+) Transcript_21287:1-2214(+)
MTPYAVMVTPKVGVALSYGALSETNSSLTLSASTDFGFTFKNGLNDRYVLSHDDLTMTMRLTGKSQSRNSLIPLAQSEVIDVLFARGCPYVTFRVDNAFPKIHSDFGIDTMVASVRSGHSNDEKTVDNITIRECAAYPACAAADLKGFCCPMSKEKGNIFHPCCSTPLATQGPAKVFNVKMKNGYYWRVYSSIETEWIWDQDQAITTEPITGIIRVALVPDASGLSSTAALIKTSKKNLTDSRLLDIHAAAYPTSANVRLEADRSKNVQFGYINFEWSVAYMGNNFLQGYEILPPLLMLALEHHTQTLVIDSTVGFFPAGSLDYRGGLKGPATAIIGSAWKMKEELTSIDWLPPNPITDPEKLDAIKKQLIIDTTRPAGETDKDAAWIAYDDWFQNPYWNGKEVGRLATLALIAENLGFEDRKITANNQLRAILDLWMTAKNGDPLVYDATYGGLSTSHGMDNHDLDFGFSFYNDHHFMLGYFLYAFAVAIKLDASFAATYRTEIFAFLYDVTNPGVGASLYEPGIDRAAFPRARHKDFYEGHSWASGIFFMGQGKAQESSSEAINCYYAAYLLALALGDIELADWNRILLAMEIRATRLYYHMPKSTLIYPKDFAANKVTGVLGALSVQSTTWFGPSTAFSHGIQILPVTPITELVWDPSFVLEDMKYLNKNLDRDSCDDTWLAFIECERAVVHPETAWQNLLAMGPTDTGTTKTALLYWVATRPSIVHKHDKETP